MLLLVSVIRSDCSMWPQQSNWLDIALSLNTILQKPQDRCDVLLPRDLILTMWAKALP